MLRLAAICLLVVSLLGRTDAFVICPIARAHGLSDVVPSVRRGMRRSVQAGAAISTRVRCTAASVLEKDIAEKVAKDGADGWKGYDRTESMNTAAAAMRPWNALWNHLASHPQFVNELWAKQPFKLSTPLPFAVGCFGLPEIEQYSHTYPAHYAASAVLTKEDGGWMMAQFDLSGRTAAGGVSSDPTAMRFEDVERSLEKGTVSLSNAGFFMPPAAAISASLLEAMQLPIWLNIYVTKAGRTSSAPPHTDKQDVIAVQAQGAKRWRVFSPPSPAAKVSADPFTRGKGADVLSVEGELDAPLIDTVLEPGQVLYIPAGFPHVTDTVNGVASQDTSVHLTLGVDTHVWDLSYACMREAALKRAGQSPLLSGTFSPTKLNRDNFLLLNAPLPLGFAAAPLLPRGASSAEAEAALVKAMARSLAERMIKVEPGRWESHDTGALVDELCLETVAERFLHHYRRVMQIERQVYADAVYQTRPVAATYERAQPYLDALTAEMEALRAWCDGKEAPASAPTSRAAPKAGKAGKGKAKGAKGFG